MPKLNETYAEIANVIRGKRSNFKLRGTKEQIAVLREVIEGCVSFRNVLMQENATLDEVQKALYKRVDSIKRFEHTFNVKWPF